MAQVKYPCVGHWGLHVSFFFRLARVRKWLQEAVGHVQYNLHVRPCYVMNLVTHAAIASMCSVLRPGAACLKCNQMFVSKISF